MGFYVARSESSSLVQALRDAVQVRKEYIEGSFTIAKNLEDDKATLREELAASTSALAQSTVLAQVARCGASMRRVMQAVCARDSDALA